MLSKPTAPTPITPEGAAIIEYIKGLEARLAALESVDVPEPLYDLGVAGWTHRWAASQLSASIGQTVTSISDAAITGAASLVTAGATVIDGGSGNRAIQVASSSLTGPTLSVAGTVVAIIRQPAGGSSVRLSTLGVGIKRAPSGQWQFTNVGTGAGDGSALLTGSADWTCVAIAVADTATFRAEANGAATASATGTWTAGTPAVLTASNIDIEEIVYFPQVLTPTELDTIYAAMQAGSSLLA